MFKRRNRVWVAVLLVGALVAGLATQAFATSVAPDRPTGLTADLDDGGVLLSWDTPDETVDSWQVLRKIRPAETAHTVVATVDGELNEWTDTDLTAGDRRYKVVAVRDSLTSRRSRVAKLVLDEPPPPLRPTPSTITQVPEMEPLTEEAAGDTCTPAADSVTATLDTWTNLTGDENWVQVTLRANVKYQIYVEKTESGDSTIDFVCDPTPEQIGNTTANPGTGLTSSDASLIFTTSAAGLHYVKITASGGKTVLVADRSNDGLEPTVAVGGTATGTFVSPTDHVGVYVPMVSGTSYQIDVRSDGHPSIDPWIRDIYDESDRITLPAGMFETSYHGFFDHDSGPGNAARVIYTATKTEDHFIVFGSLGRPSQRLGDWHLTVTETSAPFYDDFTADMSTTAGEVVVGGPAVSGRIESTPSWYNANDHGGPPGYVLGPLPSREPGYTGDHSGRSCHKETDDGIRLDGDTCDRDWFRVEIDYRKTYKLQLESGADLLIDGVYNYRGYMLQKGGTTYTSHERLKEHYISIAGSDRCSGVHGCTGSYTLKVTEE